MKTLLTAYLFHTLADDIMDKGRNKKRCIYQNHLYSFNAGFFQNKKDSFFFLMQVRKVPVQRWIGDPNQGGSSVLWDYWGMLPEHTLGCCLHRMVEVGWWSPSTFEPAGREKEESAGKGDSTKALHIISAYIPFERIYSLRLPLDVNKTKKYRLGKVVGKQPQA